MGDGHSHTHHSVSPADRSQLAQRATWVSVAVNLLMTLIQIIIGWLAHSQSLVAHGLHSFSDLLSDFLVIYASRQSNHPADEAHPYGHARIETAATLVLGVSLLLVGGGILWESGMRLHAGDLLTEVAWPAFWVAVATVLVKEGLYRYLLAVGERLRSQLLLANALHTRADAASALVVVVGIGGALFGFGYLDLLAAALMGFMILRMGAMLARDALKELVDTGLDAAQVNEIRETLLATPGVRGLHELRTRRMAHQALVDAHVQVDARISVSEGHQIAESARTRVLAAHPEVLDVLVHIDPEDDHEARRHNLKPPARAELMSILTPLLQHLPAPQRVVLHYLRGGVEIEIYMARGEFGDLKALADADQLARESLQALPYVQSVSLNYTYAP